MLVVTWAKDVVSLRDILYATNPIGRKEVLWTADCYSKPVLPQRYLEKSESVLFIHALIAVLIKVRGVTDAPSNCATSWESKGPARLHMAMHCVVNAGVQSLILRILSGYVTHIS